MRSLFIAFALVIAACGGNSAHTPPPASPAPAAPTAHAEHAEHGEHHHHGKKSDGPVKAPGEANVGDTTKCPVSGEEFVVEATSPKAEHNGKTYYFCCGGCKKKFESSPEKFLNKS